MTEQEHRREDGRGPWPPRGLAGWLVGLFVPSGADPRLAATRITLGMLEGWTSTAISVLLSATKLVLGAVTGSISVLADGVNNLADVGSSAIIALGFRWSQKPRDREHPFGHGRIETVAALVLSMALVLVALDVAKRSVGRLLSPQPMDASMVTLSIVVVTLVVKQWLARFARVLARATESAVLDADAWNHQYDVLSTAVVVLALIGSHFGFAALDGWAGLIVSVFILWTGCRVGRDSISVLLGEAPTEEELRAIRETALKHVGVYGVHDIVMHKYGDLKIGSLHIEVDASHSAMVVHDLAEEVERDVEESTGFKAIAHVDPVNRDHPRYAEVSRVLEMLMKTDARVIGFHDLRIDGDEDGVRVSVDVVVRLDVKASDCEEVRAVARSFVMANAQRVRSVEVGIESGYGGAAEGVSG